MIEIGINPIAFLGVRWYGIFIALAIVVPVLAYRTQWVKAGTQIREA